jgi:isopenicillin N synthase-like dioxygenase
MAISLAPQQCTVPESAIPVLDLGPFFAGMAGALEAATTTLRDALEEIGFFIIISHPRPPHRRSGAERSRGTPQR